MRGARAKSPALPCGVVDEPAKAGGTAQTSRASGFLATEACTPRGVATHLGKHWLNEPSAITRKAGNLNSENRSYRFHCPRSRFKDVSRFSSVRGPQECLAMHSDCRSGIPAREAEDDR